MKVMTVVGARPQFIKAALLSSVFKEKNVAETIIHTGQHYDDKMSDIFFRQMNIPTPKFNLNIRAGTHGSMTGRMLEGIEDVLLKERPDLLLVYGDTNSTLAAALAARKLNIPIAHVEAGLRNFDFTIPEDVNRTLTDRISDLLFCPTEAALRNLINEGFDKFPCKIVRTGDLMADLVSVFKTSLPIGDSSLNSYIKDLPVNGVLLTIHRQESTQPVILREIIMFLNEVSLESEIIFPIHPRTSKILAELDLKLSDKINVIEPVGYVEMQFLLSQCDHVITDSGGLQKEAYLHKKVSLLLMNYTPWVELVDNSCTVTSNLDYESLISSYAKMKAITPEFNTQLYGDGNSRYDMVREIINFRHERI